MVTCFRNHIAKPVFRASCANAGPDRLTLRPFVAYYKDLRPSAPSIGCQTVIRASLITCRAAQVRQLTCLFLYTTLFLKLYQNSNTIIS